MKIDQLIYANNKFKGEVTLGDKAQWILVFGSKQLICQSEIFDQIKCLYPNGYIMGCSSAGEIQGCNVADDTLIVTAVFLEKSSVVFSRFELENNSNYHITGKKIMDSLSAEELKHVFILCEGLNINGSKLVEGMRENNQFNIPITGGLSGDGSEFKATYVLANDYARSNQIVVAAFYGDINTSYASMGGWDTFGVERIVTKARNNVLYEIDGKPALDLYKEYLGEKANELPASALLFPLSIRERKSAHSYVRTILAVDEEKKTLTFAGDIPVGAYCRLMKANTDNLIDGSRHAIELSRDMISGQRADLAILISCIGRKLVLKQMVDEEVGVVKELMGNDTIISGFYSYGEISPYKKDTTCELHNQTMTITLIGEECCHG
ncbi:MAG: hypothetical protein CVU84_09035 [Firmicutes bacterium HGW-Firmicutes-1]|jgi:hypothetical protein|nr:MAG: hypothetical protein CVU84_09035 [Firmicutes bacterium HGW-Firmicutes-1]